MILLKEKDLDILDNMGSSELIINLFRISQTSQKLVRGKINAEKLANTNHYKAGKKIRQTIKELGGVMPEDFKMPNKSLKELEKNFYPLINSSFIYLNLILW